MHSEKGKSASLKSAVDEVHKSVEKNDDRPLCNGNVIISTSLLADDDEDLESKLQS